MVQIVFFSTPAEPVLEVGGIARRDNRELAAYFIEEGTREEDGRSVVEPKEIKLGCDSDNRELAAFFIEKAIEES